MNISNNTSSYLLLSHIQRASYTGDPKQRFPVWPVVAAVIACVLVVLQ